MHELKEIVVESLRQQSHFNLPEVQFVPKQPKALGKELQFNVKKSLQHVQDHFKQLIVKQKEAHHELSFIEPKNFTRSQKSRHVKHPLFLPPAVESAARHD